MHKSLMATAHITAVARPRAVLHEAVTDSTLATPGLQPGTQLWGSSSEAPQTKAAHRQDQGRSDAGARRGHAAANDHWAGGWQPQ